MTTKRRKRSVRRYGALSEIQRLHLACGSYLIAHDPAEEFLDEQHRRETWHEYRDTILASWDRPGARPWTLWEYDFRLRRSGDVRGWCWPRPIRTQQEMVYALIQRGELVPCSLNGALEQGEVETIEEHWFLIMRCPGACNLDQVPGWFRRKHQRRIRAEIEAERLAAEIAMAQPLNNGALA
jgi:hypothetical protein